MAPASVREAAADATPLPEEIAEHAYARFLARGGEHGHDVEDWLEAERTLVSARAATAPAPGLV